jgi:hypothetical protein
LAGQNSGNNATPPEDAMFEQELQMEKRQSTIIPLLLIVVLIVGVVGVTIYFLAENRKVLTAAEATPVIQRSVENQLPASVHFQTGSISSDASEDPSRPHYRLLEKAGYIKIGKAVKGKTSVSLTPQGQAFLDELAGVEHVRKDGNDEYMIPLAHRKFIQVGKITMQPPGKAVVEYTWKWEPTKAGDLFDAEGPLVKSFGTYERTTLIEKYGANTYHEGPSTVAVVLVKGDNGWELNTRYY